MTKFNFNDKKIAGSKGSISVIVALSVMAIILSIGLSASYTASTELSLSGDSSESAKAYYAAEAGLEEAMYDRLRGGPGNSGIIPTGTRCDSGWDSFGLARYCLVVTSIPDPPATIDDIMAIKSVGEYGSVRRSVQISF
ncbi:MAG: pilus assembly PilX N-terminal domain-containing protein [Candidatus Pacebacteria bacterium]|nr:pilus assembly PilX N-terminal domain-containing protein [Candidatus Paceibacterota bacterium]